MDFTTSLTAAAVAMCSGLCSPLDRLPFTETGNSVGMVERYFIDPKSPLLALHPDRRFDYSRQCFTTQQGVTFYHGFTDRDKAPVAWCESLRIIADQTTGLTKWEEVVDHEGECVLVSNSWLKPEWTIEHYVCREIGTS